MASVVSPAAAIAVVAAASVMVVVMAARQCRQEQESREDTGYAPNVQVAQHGFLPLRGNARLMRPTNIRAQDLIPIRVSAPESLPHSEGSVSFI